MDQYKAMGFVIRDTSDNVGVLKALYSHNGDFDKAIMELNYEWLYNKVYLTKKQYEITKANGMGFRFEK